MNQTPLIIWDPHTSLFSRDYGIRVNPENTNEAGLEWVTRSVLAKVISFVASKLGFINYQNYGIFPVFNVSRETHPRIFFSATGTEENWKTKVAGEVKAFLQKSPQPQKKLKLKDLALQINRISMLGMSETAVSRPVTTIQPQDAQQISKQLPIPAEFSEKAPDKDSVQDKVPEKRVDDLAPEVPSLPEANHTVEPSLEPSPLEVAPFSLVVEPSSVPVQPTFVAQDSVVHPKLIPLADRNIVELTVSSKDAYQSTLAPVESSQTEPVIPLVNSPEPDQTPIQQHQSPSKPKSTTVSHVKYPRFTMVASLIGMLGTILLARNGFPSTSPAVLPVPEPMPNKFPQYPNTPFCDNETMSCWDQYNVEYLPSLVNSSDKVEPPLDQVPEAGSSPDVWQKTSVFPQPSLYPWFNENTGRVTEPYRPLRRRNEENHTNKTVDIFNKGSDGARKNSEIILEENHTNKTVDVFNKGSDDARKNSEIILNDVPSDNASEQPLDTSIEQILKRLGFNEDVIPTLLLRSKEDPEFFPNLLVDIMKQGDPSMDKFAEQIFPLAFDVLVKKKLGFARKLAQSYFERYPPLDSRQFENAEHVFDKLLEIDSRQAVMFVKYWIEKTCTSIIPSDAFDKLYKKDPLSAEEFANACYPYNDEVCRKVYWKNIYKKIEESAPDVSKTIDKSVSYVFLFSMRSLLKYVCGKLIGKRINSFLEINSENISIQTVSSLFKKLNKILSKTFGKGVNPVESITKDTTISRDVSTQPENQNSISGLLSETPVKQSSNVSAQSGNQGGLNELNVGTTHEKLREKLLDSVPTFDIELKRRDIDSIHCVQGQKKRKIRIQWENSLGTAPATYESIKKEISNALKSKFDVFSVDADSNEGEECGCKINILLKNEPERGTSLCTEITGQSGEKILIISEDYKQKTCVIFYKRWLDKSVGACPSSFSRVKYDSFFYVFGPNELSMGATACSDAVKNCAEYIEKNINKQFEDQGIPSGLPVGTVAQNSRKDLSNSLPKSEMDLEATDVKSIHFVQGQKKRKIYIRINTQTIAVPREKIKLEIKNQLKSEFEVEFVDAGSNEEKESQCVANIVLRLHTARICPDNQKTLFIGVEECWRPKTCLIYVLLYKDRSKGAHISDTQILPEYAHEVFGDYDGLSMHAKQCQKLVEGCASYIKKIINKQLSSDSDRTDK